MASIREMVIRVSGLQGTKELNQWEDGFVKSIVERSRNGEDTTQLTTKQVERLEELHGKFFSG